MTYLLIESTTAPAADGMPRTEHRIAATVSPNERGLWEGFILMPGIEDPIAFSNYRDFAAHMIDDVTTYLNHYDPIQTSELP